MKKTVIPIKGMHCRSCEILIEDELKKVDWIKKASVSQARCEAIIWSETEMTDETAISTAVKKAGYEIGKNEEKPLFSRNSQDYAEIFLAVIIVLLLYFALDLLGLKKILSASPSQASGWLSILLIGLTAGFSTCMALVGGLVLGVAARFAENQPNLSNLKKFQPHLFFNAGRIVFFFIFGGIIGAIGSFLQLSGPSLGIMTLAVALVMFLMGIQLTGLFPRLSSFSFVLPKWIVRRLGIEEKKNKQYSHKNAFLLGGLTFFLPCGFTQAVQMMAVASGSFWKGALLMAIFALGTAPGLLGIGGLTSVIKGESAQKFFKFVGVAVIFMAIFNLRNGVNLLGTSLGFLGVKASTGENGNLINGTQVVRMEQNYSGYTPNSFTIKRDVPVRWIINSKDPNSCAASLIVSKLNIRKFLSAGENIIEFTPKETGKIGFSCSMGMFTGVFNVIDNQNSGKTQLSNNSNTTSNSSAPITNTSGGCGCGGTRTVPSLNPQNITAPTWEDNTQVIRTVYTLEKDIFPNQFSVKANLPVRMEIEVKDNGVGCMETIVIPQFNTDVQSLIKGKTIIFNFLPTKPGEYPITCAMGVPRGVIKII